MSSKLSNAPIFFAASQVVFNEIRGMSKYVDAIQDKMRGLKYVDFGKSEENILQINVAAQDSAVQQTQTTRWQFVNFEKTAGFVLTPNMLFFQTTAYETSDELRQSLLEGLRVVHEIVGLNFVNSIGLRTLDAIVPHGKESIRDYIAPGLIGFSEAFQGTLRHSINEAVYKTANGMLIARMVILGPETPSIGVPFDLHPINLQFSDRFQSIKGRHAILDCDTVDQSRFEFDFDEIEKKFKSIKSGITEVFGAAVTTYAREQWK